VQLIEIGRVVEARVPAADAVGVFALLVTQVAPLAHRGAQRPGVVAGGAVAEKVGKVEETRGPPPRLGEVLLEPQELRGLHFGRHPTAHISEHRVLGGVDAGCLIHCPVVHPDDHVLLVVAGRAHRHRPVVGVERHQRAGGVEADAADRRR